MRLGKIHLLIGLLLLGVLMQKLLITRSLNIDFKYRIPIYITEYAGRNYTDGRVLLIVDTATLINQGKLRPDCADIRFYLYNETNESFVKIPYWIERGCGTNHTRIWIKIPYIPPNQTITVYMYYGNPLARSESNKSAIGEVEVVIGKYFQEHTLNNAHHCPNINDIGITWSDAGRDAFDGYGRTYMYEDPNTRGTWHQFPNIIPLERGEQYRYFWMNFNDGRKYIVYKDMLPCRYGSRTCNGVLRIVILPANKEALEKPYSVYRTGNLGSDSSTHMQSYTFTCNVDGENRTYRFYMTWDWSANPGSGDPNIWYFMFCVGHSNTEQNGVRFEIQRSGDNLYERLYNAQGLCVLYLAPTDNPLNDNNIKQLLCEEINYWEQFRGKIFKLDNQGNFVTQGIEPVRTVRITFGQEERLTTEPDYYKGIEIKVSPSYELGENVTVFAQLKVEELSEPPSKVQLEVLDPQGNKVYGPVNMTRIAPYIYSYTFNSSEIGPGNYLVRVLIWFPDNKIYGGVAPLTIHTNVLELKQEIRKNTQAILEYLQNVIYPELQSIEQQVANLSQQSYSQLLELRNQIQNVIDNINIVSEQISSTNKTLYQELQQIKANQQEILHRINILIDTIHNIVIYKLDNLATKVSTIQEDLTSLRNTVSSEVIPKLDVLQAYLNNIQQDIQDLNESIAYQYKDITSRIELLRDDVSRALQKIDEILALLKCDVVPQGSVCEQLSNIKRMLQSLQADTTDIKTALNSLNDYIRNVLYPQLVEINSKVEAVLNNQTKSYNKLLELYNELQSQSELLTTILSNIKELNITIYEGFDEQARRLQGLQTQLESELESLRQNITMQISTLSTKLDTLEHYIIQLKAMINCEENVALCTKLDTALTELSSIKKEVLTIKENVTYLKPIQTNLTLIQKKVLEIENYVANTYGIVRSNEALLEQINETINDIYNSLSSLSEKIIGTKSSILTRPPSGIQTVIPTPTVIKIAVPLAILIVAVLIAKFLLHI